MMIAGTLANTISNPERCIYPSQANIFQLSQNLEVNISPNIGLFYAPSQIRGCLSGFSLVPAFGDEMCKFQCFRVDIVSDARSAF